jgi:pilin isopeptide linkage protein
MQVFAYLLKPITPGAPMPSGSSTEGYAFTIITTNTVSVGPITFFEPGTYTYKLNCVTNTIPGYTCDQQVYTIDVCVFGDMTASVVVYRNDGAKVANIEYGHVFRYEALPSDPKTMIDPPVVKTLTGNPVPIGIFTFQLSAENPSNPMPSGSINGNKTIQIMGSGQAEFGTWAYTAEGIYHYTVNEINSGVRGYTYDTAVYTITDSVKAENGQLIVTRVVTNSSKQQVTSLPFINNYNSGGGGTTPSRPTPTPTPYPTPGDPEDPTPTPSPEDTTVPGDPSPPPDKPSITDIGDGGNPPFNSTPGRIPKTGDESVVIPYIILFFTAGISALGSAVYLMTCKRRSNADDN